jgi:hypothetical protein
MCNFIRSNGEQCKLARNKERCAKHPIVAITENNNKVSIVVETVMVPNQVVNTSPIEVVDMPSASVIKPVEASNVVDEVNEMPDMTESSVAQRIADETVYKEDQTSDLELNNSNDEEENEFFIDNYVELEQCVQHDVKDEMKEFPLGISDTIVAFENYLDEHNIEVAIAEKTDKRVYEDGFRYCFYIRQGKKTLMHYYCKTEQMMKNIPIMINEINVTQYCLSNECYDQRLYKLCCLLKKSWFSDNNNTWSLAGVLYRKQNVDLGLRTCASYIR